LLTIHPKVGHGKRVQQIRELLSELFPAGPGKSKISVVGAAFNGVSINDCIRTGYEQAASFIMQNPTCQ
jgi:protoporphyrinogen oxidase